MATWLKELGIIAGVFIITGAECLLVLIAYHKYCNWWDSRHAIAKHPQYPTGKRSGEEREHGVVNGIISKFKKYKGEKSEKSLSQHKVLYHGNKPKGNDTLPRPFGENLSRSVYQ
jgi:hypothetical protein